jgi:hypothetical protein
MKNEDWRGEYRKTEKIKRANANIVAEPAKPCFVL